MQFKLLNYYKIISKVASNLVGAFVPLIVYEATQSLIFAGLYMLLKQVFRLLCGIIMRKHIQNHPEIFLMLRIFVIAAYCISLTFVAEYVLVGCLCVALFAGIDTSFQMIAEETLFNYSSSKNMDSKKIAATRIFGELGYFAGVIVGGLILDVNPIVVYIIAVVVYVISICPLLIFYIHNRRSPSFNKEYVSNISEYVSKSDKKLPKIKYLSLMIMISYAIIYFCYSAADTIFGVFNVGMFIEGDISYANVSVFILIYETFLLIGNLIVGYIDKKFDLLNVVRISCYVICASFVGMCFIKNVVILYILFALFGLFYASICCFVLQRFVQKARIIGQSNNAFMVREAANCTGYTVAYIVLMILILLEVSIFYFLLYCAAMLLITSFVIPVLEEKTRKLLVDFVEDNEITTTPIPDKRN